MLTGEELQELQTILYEVFSELTKSLLDDETKKGYIKSLRLQKEYSKFKKFYDQENPEEKKAKKRAERAKSEKPDLEKKEEKLPEKAAKNTEKLPDEDPIKKKVKNDEIK